jgi:hypothetical protein
MPSRELEAQAADLAQEKTCQVTLTKSDHKSELNYYALPVVDRE